MADIKHAIRIAAAPEKVYALAGTPNGLREWWAADVTDADGAVELGFFNRNTVYRLRLQTDEPPVHADWLCETGKEWSGTHITFQLEGRDNATILRFTHGGWQSETEYFRDCNTTWGELMFRLKSAAEGKPRGPLFLADQLAY